MDFQSRLATRDTEQVKMESLDKITALEVALLDEQSKQKIQALLTNFDVEEKAPAKVAVKKEKPVPQVFIMGQEQQAQQQGSLLDLYDGNHKFQLIATFNDSGQKFALLLQKDLVTGKSEKIRLGMGEKISHYSLTKIDNRAIQVELDGRVIQLQLFQYKQPHV